MRGVPVQMGDKARGACMMRSNASWVMVTWDPPLDRQTDTTKNITFLQLRWREVIMCRTVLFGSKGFVNCEKK